MKISYAWIGSLLPHDLTPEGMSSLLTSTGLEVEGIESTIPPAEAFVDVVTARIVECSPVENSDHLQLCRVDAGEGGELLSVVCGAPNARAGLITVLAKVGATLYPHEHEPLRIKKSKIRGVESNGMLCAEDELGVGTSHAGIIELPEDTKLGITADALFADRRDYILEVALTANRSDAMSHIGVARDIAARLSLTKPVRPTLPPVATLGGEPSPTQVQLGSFDPALCMRYMGVTMTGIKVGPSPEWMQSRLREIGVKPISNVVDVTNWILFETGHPLHAFDRRAFTSNRVSVASIAKGEGFAALDHATHVLTGSEAMVCDEGRPRCMAGIIGGDESAIKDSTTSIFIEAAVFSPGAIRKAAKAHGIATDASFRFERGVDPSLSPYALARAVYLIQELTGAQVDGSPIDWYPTPVAHEPFEFSLTWAEQFLGLEIGEARLERVFESLDIDYQRLDEGLYRVTPPYYRVDVTRREDVAEEVLRIVGYDQVPLPHYIPVPLSGPGHSVAESPKARARTILAAGGAQQIMSTTLTPSQRVEAACPGVTPVRIANPLSTELDVLRPTLLLGGLDALHRNLARQSDSLLFFEFGHVFSMRPAEEGKEGLKASRERDMLALWATGPEHPESWREPAVASSPITLKGAIEPLLRLAGLEFARMSSAPVTESLYEYGVEYSHGGAPLVRLGVVKGSLIAQAGIKRREVSYAEVEWERLEKLIEGYRPRYRALPKFPRVTRDLALFVPDGVTYESMSGVITKAAGKLSRGVELFDAYQPSDRPAGHYACAVRVHLQDLNETLTDARIAKVMAQVGRELEKECGAKVRG